MNLLSLPKIQLAAHQRSERCSMSVALRIKPRVAGVLPQETRLRIANERKVRCILTQALGSLCRSGSFARVKMMQAADLWDLHHLAKRGRLDSSADRRMLLERQMHTAPFVVCKILLQGLARPNLTEDQDVVQTVPSNLAGVGVSSA
jgi:hypothetical protein